MRIFPVAILYILIAVVLAQNVRLLTGHQLAVSAIGIKENKIHWDKASLLRISPDSSTGFYPRMLQLKDSRLVCVYASNGNIVMQKSVDAGRHWQSPTTIAGKETGINMDTPELLQLFNGDVLVCYNGRPRKAVQGSPEADKRFDIRVKKSNNGGTQWGEEKILYQAGSSFKDGCWEPAALQLPSGEIQLFFSDEGIYTNSNEQNISMLQSADNGNTWTVKPQIISFRRNSRDGMPVPVWLPERKEIAVAIEDPGNKNFKPYIVHSSAMGVWEYTINADDPKRVYALAGKIPDSIYAGAPYLRRLSSGKTILSYQSTEGRVGNNSTDNAVMMVAIGDENAAGFKTKSIPFDVPENRHALWNSLCVLTGDTIIAVTSTNAYSKASSEIWMIRGWLQ